MKKIHWLIVFILIFIAVSLIAYKTFILGVSFIPREEKNLWNVELAVRVQPSTKSRKIGFPIPRQSDRISIKNTQYDGKGMSLTIEKTPDGVRGQWSGKMSEKRTLYYRVSLAIKEKHYTLPALELPEPKGARTKEFLTVEDLEPEDIKAIKKIEGEILSPSISPQRAIKEIFYFIYEEILINSRRQWKNLSDIAEHLEADSLGKARLFTVMARRQGIPCRTVGGLILRPEKKLDEKGRYELSYWNEINIGGKWIPVCTSYGNFAYLSDEYLPLFWNINNTETILNDENASLRITANRVDSAEFTIQEYRKELRRTKSWLMEYSLYLLPIHVQSVFRVLILIPFGAVVLVIFRNIIGVKTFGIFLPVLLALFFQETGFLFGFFFFSAIVGTGFLLRFLLKKMQLLAIPHLSIILTAVVMMLCIFAVFNRELRIFREFTPALFPIVITTIFIERFGLMLEEEGLQNTLASLIGSIIIATITYGIFSIRTLQSVVFTHPETLFILIAIFIMVGKYTGYRVSELVRFRAFLKKEA